jgi:uncharacterized protein YjbI with pentapeptide repeats
LAALQPGADLDLRGTPIDTDLVIPLLGAVKTDEGPRLGNVDFRLAQFSRAATFNEAQFSGDASFDGARFSGDASFDGARFSGDAGFDEARFSGDAWFVGARFSGDAGFVEARFGGAAWFVEAQFSGDAGFVEAWFSGNAWFIEAKFSGDAKFREAKFSRGAWFVQARFSGDAGFVGAQVRADALFARAQFPEVRALGPFQAWGRVSLDEASFSAPILIEAAALQVSLVGATFTEAATLRLRFVEIVLDGALFMKPSTISFAENAFRFRSGKGVKEIAVEMDNRPPRPRLLSLRRVDVATLVLGNLDLSACLFNGAHNLERLRIEGPLSFALTPGASRLRFRRRWVRRQTLAEEHHFRAPPPGGDRAELGQRFRRLGWNPAACQAPSWVVEVSEQPVQMLQPENLATLYRALRRGLEDQQNAPGAADFYYGEMEMRRLSSTATRSDRFVLWVYWLFSGYGLVTSRALVAFGLVVPLFAIGFWLWGLNPEHGHPLGYQTALLRSFESATSLLRPAPAGLTEFGQLLDAVLRLIGATLLRLEGSRSAPEAYAPTRAPSPAFRRALQAPRPPGPSPRRSR